MTNLPNHKDLFRWKRRTDPIVHPSDGRKDVGVRSEEDEVQRWLKRVEAATDVAAHQTFDSEPNPTADGASNLHRHFSNNIRFHEQSSEIAYAEAQDLLNDWMTKNFIHDLIGQETEEEVNYERSPSPTYFQSDVAEAVKTNIHIETLYDNIEAINENDVVQNIMANLLEAPIESNVLNITKSKKNTAEPVTKQLKTKPTKNMMVKLLEEEENKKLKVNLKERSAKRHEQVRKNRVLREQEIQQEREKRLAMRELTLEAKHMVVKEETDAATRRGKEEEAIRGEMARIKCEMEGEKIREAKELKRQMEEEINQVRRLEEEKQMQIKLQEKTKFEEAKRERERNMKLHTLDIKIRNSQLRTLRIHFSAWHNTIIDDRLRMGQARAIADWRLLMRTWSHWNSKYRILWATQEGQKHLEKMRETQRQQKAATDFYKRQLLLKCLRNWNIWVRQKQLEKEILQEKEETQRKMEAFLKACALNEQDDVDDESEDFSLKNKSISQTDKAKSQPRRLEPWQITKKHVYEGLESIHTTSAPKPAPKSRATYVVDAFQHRHAAQEQMLKTQQEIIKEQQKMLEEMKFLRTQQDLQTQLKMLNLDQANQNKTGSPKATSKDPQIEKKESSSEATQKVLVKTAGGKETNRPNKFVMDMEERAKQRGDRKAELERLKQKKLEEKQDATRKVEEEARKKEEEEKQKKLEQIREKKKQEKELEIEKQKKVDEMKMKQDMADNHNHQRLLKWYGITDWKKLLNDKHQNEAKAIEFHQRLLMKNNFKEWFTMVKELNDKRDQKWKKCLRYQSLRKSFNVWRKIKENSLLLDLEARKHWAKTIMDTALKQWVDFTYKVKLIGWEKERLAKEFNEKTLMKKVFEGFKLVPLLVKREKERESRKDYLRRKVADLLPDYQANC